MKINIKRTPQTILSVKILTIIGIAFLFYLIGNNIYLRWSTYSEIKQYLQNVNNSIVQKSIFPYYDYPVYIFSTSGFASVRIKAIGGFLDSGSFDFNSYFQTPQTYTFPENNTSYRLYSKVISENNIPEVSILVGYNTSSNIYVSDDQLIDATEILSSQIKIAEGIVDASKVKTLSIPPSIQVLIIDKFNRILISNGTIPSYIDRSYIAEELKWIGKYRTVIDQSTMNPFLVYGTKWRDDIIVVSGYPLTQANNALSKQLVFSVGTGAGVILILLLLLAFLLQKEINTLLIKAEKAVQKVFYVSHRAGAFGFDQDTGLIYLGDKKMEVPVKTKQYYICKVLFSKPNKNWENDEIMDRLPEHALETEALDTYESLGGNDLRKKARMIYDAIRLLNEKANGVFSYDVVLIQGKTYRINPNIQPQNG